MHQDFGPAQLQNLRSVDFEGLETASSEAPFNQAGFGLLKDAVALLVVIAGLRTTEHGAGLERNHAIVLGHYTRMAKLMIALVRQVSDEHGGDQQTSILRQFMDSVSTVAYLLADDSTGARFDSYVFDSVIAEREFLRDVQSQVDARRDGALPIEMRIRRSIARTLEAAGVTEEEVPSRRSNGWPSAQTRMALLGPTAYSAYRTGSAAIHGGFSEIFMNHLDVVEAGFEIRFDPQPVRPQPMIAMAVLALSTLSDYSRRFLGGPLPDALEENGAVLLQAVRRLDELHEAFLVDRSSDA